jgi:hypothetical protein
MFKRYRMRVEGTFERCERMQAENFDNAKWRGRWEKLATSLWERRAVRLGVARGRFDVPASVDQSNEELAEEFLGTGKVSE